MGPRPVGSTSPGSPVQGASSNGRRRQGDQGESGVTQGQPAAALAASSSGAGLPAPNQREHHQRYHMSASGDGSPVHPEPPTPPAIPLNRRVVRLELRRDSPASFEVLDAINIRIRGFGQRGDVRGLFFSSEPDDRSSSAQLRTEHPNSRGAAAGGGPVRASESRGMSSPGSSPPSPPPSSGARPKLTRPGGFDGSPPPPPPPRRPGDNAPLLPPRRPIGRRTDFLQQHGQDQRPASPTGSDSSEGEDTFL